MVIAAWIASACAAQPAVPAAATGLKGTRWQLAVITSMDDAQPPLRSAVPGRYTIEFGVDGSLRVQLDCNRGRAAWSAEAAPGATAARRSGSVVFGPLAMTRAQCPAGSLEPRLSALFPYVRSFVIENGALHLSLMADGGIITWDPIPAGGTSR